MNTLSPDWATHAECGANVLKISTSQDVARSGDLFD